jgi:hypothetical protein
MRRGWRQYPRPSRRRLKKVFAGNCLTLSALPRAARRIVLIPELSPSFSIIYIRHDGCTLVTSADVRSNPAPTDPLYTQDNLPKVSVNFLSRFVNFVQLISSRVPEFCSGVFFG